MSAAIRGVLAVVPTPLADDESIDERGLRHLVDWYVERGCHGLVILGSGGELAYLREDERVRVAHVALDQARGRVPVIIGAAAHAVGTLEAFFAAVDPARPSAYLVALPAYHPLAADHVVRAYQRLTASTATPLFYYHFPQVTGVDLPAADLARIFALPGIVGVKESTVRLAEIRAHLAAARGTSCAVYAGTSFVLTDVVAAGGAGVICPIAAIDPVRVIACWDALASGHHTDARRLQTEIRALVPLMNRLGPPVWAQRLALAGARHAPVPIKAGGASRQAVLKETLRQLGHPITARVRAPLPALAPGDGAAIAALISAARIPRVDQPTASPREHVA